MYNAVKTTIKTIRKVIHIGERTHHHDQVIKLVSFKVINTMPSNPVNPIPPLLLFDSLII